MTQLRTIRTRIQEVLDPGGQIPSEVAAGVPHAEGARAYVRRRWALGVGRSDGAAPEEVGHLVAGLIRSLRR